MRKNRLDNRLDRVLLYVHEGRGLGHLRRIATIADHLQDTCSTLIVSGHKELGWLPKHDCEFVHLPSLEGIDPNYLKYNQRRPFMPGDPRRALAVRKSILEATALAFSPDAIVVDYLPFGNDNEMLGILRSANCLKYWILRGIVDEKSAALREIFFDQQAIIDIYNRVFIACDAAIIDVQAEYGLDHRIGQLFTYTGYVCASSLPEERRLLRLTRGILPYQQWVVCSAGGGKKLDEFFSSCIDTACYFPRVRFDVVLGPRFEPGARLNEWRDTPPNVNLYRDTADLPLWHAASDVVICHGGYNSMTEAISARVPVIVFPGNIDAERISHARRLAEFNVVCLAERASEIPRYLTELLSTPRREENILAMNGATFITNSIRDDLYVMRKGI